MPKKLSVSPTRFVSEASDAATGSPTRHELDLTEATCKVDWSLEAAPHRRSASKLKYYLADLTEPEFTSGAAVELALQADQ